MSDLRRIYEAPRRELRCRPTRAVILGVCLLGAIVSNSRVDADELKGLALEEVLVYGLSPLSDELGRAEGEVSSVQIFSGKALQQASSLANVLERYAAGVSINDAQNNPLQPDVRFRGYSASPLLGAAQGMVVYYNGVRVNEVFGDTVNWDLLPGSAVQSMALVAGSNPVFGQNALGGAIVVRGKDGFNSAGGALEIGGGNYGEQIYRLSQGGNSDSIAYFLALDHYEEDGWRDFSPTQADSVYVALSHRDERNVSHLYLNYGDTQLFGNGAAPERLLEEDREAVFTHPDITNNSLLMLVLNTEHFVNDDSRVVANIFYRELETSSFNGDGSEFEECASDESVLCEDDEPDEQLYDRDGQAVSSDFDAINNISSRDQNSYGATLQWYLSANLGARRHHLTFGAEYLYGETDFFSEVEFAMLTPSRSTTRSGRYDAEGDTALNAEIQMSAFYIADIIELSEDLKLNASLRHNRVAIRSRDRSGDDPDLNASHEYQSLNGALGLVYQLTENLQAYGGVSRSSRAPTPVELACSHEDAPCTLPNTFLADPPLDDVVATTVETGLRGEGGELSGRWQIGIYETRNRDEIQFQTTGGVSSNEGFFTNIGDTRHRGIELTAAVKRRGWEINGSYSYLDATVEENYIAFTPNHPEASNGTLAVDSGSSLPGLPKHNVKLAADWLPIKELAFGFEMTSASRVYLRGDEANRDKAIPGFTVFNARIRYRPTEAITLSVNVKNLFDREYARFGLYGEADEIFDDYEDDETRFISPAAPRRMNLVLKMEW